MSCAFKDVGCGLVTGARGGGGLDACAYKVVPAVGAGTFLSMGGVIVSAERGGKFCC